jgi:acid phosphatase (class A)
MIPFFRIRPMLKRIALLGITALFLALPSRPAFAHRDEGTLVPYPIGGQLDLTMLLAPPPAEDSAETKQELEELLKIQAARTDAQAAEAVADHA